MPIRGVIFIFITALAGTAAISFRREITAWLKEKLFAAKKSDGHKEEDVKNEEEQEISDED